MNANIRKKDRECSTWKEAWDTALCAHRRLSRLHHWPRSQTLIFFSRTKPCTLPTKKKKKNSQKCSITTQHKKQRVWIPSAYDTHHNQPLHAEAILLFVNNLTSVCVFGGNNMQHLSNRWNPCKLQRGAAASS